MPTAYENTVPRFDLLKISKDFQIILDVFPRMSSAIIAGIGIVSAFIKDERRRSLKVFYENMMTSRLCFCVL